MFGRATPTCSYYVENFIRILVQMFPESRRITHLIDGSFRKEDGGQGSSTKHQTLNKSDSLLQDSDRLEEEATKLRNDILRLEAKLVSTQQKEQDGVPNRPVTANISSHTLQTEKNYSIKLKHKFYEFTGISIKNIAEDMMTVFFYVKHDDWSKDVRPYWLKMSIGETPKVFSYDLPFMVDMRDIQANRPIVNNDDLFAFLDYVRRCIESYFERRQQVHELEKALNPAYARVEGDIQYMLIQIKLFAKKSKPEKNFSIWYREDAALPSKCIVRILEDGYKELVENLATELKALNSKPLPEAFIESIQKYVDLEGSADESSTTEFEEDDTSNLEEWFLPLQTSASKGSKKGLSKTKGRKRAAATVKGTSKDDDVWDGPVSPGPPVKRSRKLNKQSPHWLKRRTQKYPQDMKGGKSTPGVSLRVRVDTPQKMDTANWRKETAADVRKSGSSSPRKSGQTGKGVHTRADKRNSSSLKNTSPESTDNTRKKVDIRHSPRKSIRFDLSKSSPKNSREKQVANPRRQTANAESSAKGRRTSSQSSIANFLKPINASEEKVDVPNTSKPRERNVESVLYRNEFESDGSDDQASLHSAETLPRSPRLQPVRLP